MNGQKLKIFWMILRRGHLDVFWREARRRIFSTERVYIVRRRYGVPGPTPAARTPVAFRPIREDEVRQLLDPETPGISGRETWDRVRRLLIFQAGIETCYVGVDPGGKPCHLQWLIGPEENGRLHSFSKGGFLPLQEDEMLLEGGFTPETFRGQGLMALAMARIPEVGGTGAMRWVLGFIRAANISSLKSAKRAGYRPHIIRRETWRFFRRRIEYQVVPPEFPYPFEKEAPRASPETQPFTASSPAESGPRDFARQE